MKNHTRMSSYTCVVFDVDHSMKYMDIDVHISLHYFDGW